MINKNYSIDIGVLQFPLKERYRAWQGVSVVNDLVYVFTDRDENFGFENIISVYSLDGNFISEKRNAYTGIDEQGRFMSFGDANEIDGFLYATAYNINDGGNPLISRIVKFNVSDLSIDNIYDIGSDTAESVTKHNDAFWVVYHDVPVVKKFDLEFNFIQEYSLLVGEHPFGLLQGTLWDGNLFYANLHGHNSNSSNEAFAEIRKYEFNGSKFNFIESMQPPTDGCNQGLSEYNGLYFWNDRANNLIVVSKSIKRENMYSENLPYQKECSFTLPLLNGWEPFDSNYDRPARATVINGIVYLSGIIKNNISVNPYDGATPMFKIPFRHSPKYSINVSVLCNKGVLRLAIIGKYSSSPDGLTGNVVVQNILSYEGIMWVSLDGISYPIME